MRAVPIRERFEGKYIPEPNSGCWLWLGSVVRPEWPYGTIRQDRSRKMLLAHRVSWELHCGCIPAGLDVLHQCDTPSCVNPNHLFVGTKSDNAQDCYNKGRANKPNGSTDHHWTKLTEAQAREIKYGPGRNVDLARRFGIAACSVSDIRHGRSWKHL